MRKFKSILLFTLISLFIVSCGKKEKNDNNTIDISPAFESTTDTNEDLDASITDNALYSSDWDDILDEYEEFVDEYLDLVESVSNGNLSAMSEMDQILQKAESISNKLSTAEGELTSKQWSHYMNVLQKMTNAANTAVSNSFNAIDEAAESLEDALDITEKALDKLDDIEDLEDELSELENLDF